MKYRRVTPIFSAVLVAGCVLMAGCDADQSRCPTEIQADYALDRAGTGFLIEVFNITGCGLYASYNRMLWMGGFG